MTKLIVVILLLLACNAVMVDCHGDCDSDQCCHICAHAMISEAYVVGFDFNGHGYSFNHNSQIPFISPENVFQPPRAKA
ncbi:MAG: hypothetical protein Q7N50_14480 [Armatimonadota bacterium]|nr:hypothetical protein [Armatimonadota bacterium]